MSTTQPIKNMGELKRFEDYYFKICPDDRNRLLIIVALNTALRISDILSLKCEDVFSYEAMQLKKYIIVREQKTNKTNCIYINDQLRDTLLDTVNFTLKKPIDWLFTSKKGTDMPLSRYQALRLISKAARESGLSIPVSPHSLRKTFGYHAWMQGASPVILMSVYNHSSYNVTKRYLGIDQSEKDNIYRKIQL